MLPMLLMLLSRFLNPGTAQRRDSYLEAYAESHGTSVSPYGHISRDPGVVYGAPTEYEYYDEHTYPTTSSSYGPPGHTMYGPPPTEMMGHGVDMHSGPVGLPRGLDIATLCKIILKVLIFKLIVKFIAVICVLLFLPKLDMGSSGSSSKDDRAFQNDAVDDLTRLVLQGIDKGADVANCKEKNSVPCILQRVSRLLDKQNTVPRLLKMFVAEEQVRHIEPKRT